MTNIDPLQTSTRVLIGKWKPILLWHLSVSTHRFSDLKRCITDASPKMITQQLRELEADGLVTRKVYPEVPPKVEYSLTAHGKTAGPILKQFVEWGVTHLKTADGSEALTNEDFKCVCSLEKTER